MTALWCDGFDGYIDLTQKYDTTTLVTLGGSSGRYGTAGIAFTTGSGAIVGTLTKNITASSALVAGIAWYGNSISTHTTSSLGSDYILAFYSGSTLQIALSVMSDGTLVVHNGSTVLGQSTNALSMYNWYYLELKSTGFSASADFKVHVTLGNDESAWVIGTGNTNSAGSGTANKVSIGSLCEPDVDDFYILNGLGDVNNNFLGDSRVLSLLPRIDGTYKQWTPSTGTDHFALIDEVPASSSDYVSISEGATDTYRMTIQDSFLKNADFIQQCFFVSSGSRSAPPIVPTAVVNFDVYYNPAIAVPISSAYVYSIWERRPDSGTEWTGNSLNNNEFGVS